MPNVQQLIELLQAVEDKSAAVILEGCDCYGYWSGEILVSSDKRTLRNDNNTFTVKEVATVDLLRMYTSEENEFWENLK